MDNSTSFIVQSILLSLILSQAFAACANTVLKNFTSSNDGTILYNPERGFYQTQEFETTLTGYDPIYLADLQDTSQQNFSLVLVQYYLFPFLTLNISSPVLQNIDTDMQTVRQAGLKTILRFSYSSTTSQDSKLIQLQNHIDQVQRIISKNSDVILAVQAGFVGQWGEWYFSDNYGTAFDGNIIPVGKDNPQKVLDKLMKSITPRMVQVRTPTIKQKYCGNANILNSNGFNLSLPCSRLGIHNDCFLAPNQDEGTFENNTQRTWLQVEGQYIMVGGETCDVAGTVDCTSSLTQILNQRFTYLNLDYNDQVIQGWRNGNCFNQIANRLGYHFKLISGQFPSQVKAGTTYCATVTLTNTGVAPVYYSRPVQIILRNKATIFTAAVNTDIRNWASGQNIGLNLNISIPSTAPLAVYDVILNLPDVSTGLQSRPEYRIVFANENVVEWTTRYNILSQVQVN